MSLKVELLPVFEDNYIFILTNPLTGYMGVVDPGQARPVIQYLERNQNNNPPLKLKHIFLTHHHFDHVGGVKELCDYVKNVVPDSIEVIGNHQDQYRLPPLTRFVDEGDRIEVDSSLVQVIAVPGHTRGHLAYWFPQEKFLFCGDTLFSMGCGRLFEGSAQQMWSSLEKLMKLPDDTLIFCAHEYTQANTKWALTLLPQHKQLQEYSQKVQQLREAQIPSLPTSLKIEKTLNPFLNPTHPEIKRFLKITSHDPIVCFSALRSFKDQF